MSEVRLSAETRTEFPDNYDIGAVLQPNLPLSNLLTDLTLTYTIKGVSPDNLPAGLAVPEPTSAAMLALACIPMLYRRTRRAH